MISIKGRGDSRLEQQFRIWDLLTEEGPMSPGALRQKLGFEDRRSGLRRALKNMRRKGSVVALGVTSSRMYYATNVEPFIRQRKENTPEQEAGLAKGRLKGLQAISLKRWGKPFTPRPKHHLDRALGYAPLRRAA